MLAQRLEAPEVPKISPAASICPVERSAPDLNVEAGGKICGMMPHPIPEWQHLALYALGAALLIMLIQRIPVVGRLIRFAVSLGLLAFFIYLVLQQAPYQPQLARFTSALGLDDQKVEGRELHVQMSGDGHFWVVASINGVKRRMLIDSGATVTAISDNTARAASVDTGAGLTPVVLRTANGMAPARTGSVDELKVGNI